MNLRDDRRVDGVEGRARRRRAAWVRAVGAPRAASRARTFRRLGKDAATKPVDHVGRRPKLMANKINVELVRAADPAPRYNPGPAVPGPALDLVLQPLRRLRDVGLHLGVEAHVC